MKPFPFAVLAALTAAVAGAALYAVAVRTTETAPEVAVGAPLMPGLTEHINQVVAMTIAGGGGSVTVARPGPDSDRWTVADKANYPAALDQVRRTILGLDAAKTLEPRTVRPEQYGKLQVDDAGAVHLSLRLADGSALPTVLVGKIVVSPNSDHPVHQFYARRAGEAQSWLAVGQVPSLTIDPMQWVDRTLPAVVARRVMTVTVSRPGVAPLTITRSDAKQPDFTVDGLKAGAKPKQATVNEWASAVEFLSFEDVAKQDPASQPRADTTFTTIRTFDGVVLTVRIDRHDDKPWATFAAEVDSAQAAKAAAQPEAGAPDPVHEVQEIQERTAAWSYRLSEYAAKELAPEADDLTEKPAKPAAPAAP